MKYRTLEVELENGHVHTSGSEVLPTKARALLTILETNGNSEKSKDSLGDRVASLAGIGRGIFSDLSTNEAQLNDFGQ